MEPLPSKWGPHWKGTGVVPVLNAVFVVAFIAVVVQAEVLPLRDQMQQVHKAMCGGVKDFVYSNVDGKHFGFVHVTDTPAFEIGLAPSFTEKCVQDVIAQGGPRFANAVIYHRTTTAFSNAMTMDSARFTSWFTMHTKICQDALGLSPGSDDALLTTVREISGRSDVATCSDLRGSCGDWNDYLPRLLCPETCGCNDPHSGLYWTSPGYGCSGCGGVEHDGYTSIRETMPCEDFSVETLQNHTGWQSYWSQLFHHIKRDYPEDVEVHEIYIQLLSNILFNGCTAIHSAYNSENSYESYFVSQFDEWCGVRWSGESDGDGVTLGVSMFCPVACGCLDSSKDVRICPGSCRNDEP